MASLTLGNSVCHLAGLTSGQLSELRKTCTYTTGSGRRVPRKTKAGRTVWVEEKQVCHLMSSKGAFPTGLLYRVEDYIRSRGWPLNIVDDRRRPQLNSISAKTLYVQKKFEPYPEQKAAAEAALEYERGIIVGPTGVGKSAICELICDAYRVPTLIVVPTLELKRQLTQSLREAFGAERVGPLGKSCSPTYPISVENVDALDADRKLKGIDCVIVDEYHHSAAASYRALNLKSWTDVYFKIGLTATPFRSNDEERLLLESVLSQVIYRIPYETAVEKKYIVPMEAYYVELPKIKKGVAMDNYAKAYAYWVVNNPELNAIIAQMTANLIEAGKATLVLTKQIEHGVQLQLALEQLGHLVPFAEGTSELKSEDIAAFNSQQQVALIGTSGVLGEGVDTKPCEYVILAGGGKSKNAFMQQVGRGFRRYGDKETCKIIMFKNPNNKWLLEHFNACQTYLLEEYGVVAEKLDLGT